MTARDEILSKVKNALGRGNAVSGARQVGHAHGSSVPSPLPEYTPLPAAQIHSINEQQRPALIQQFAAALSLAGGRFTAADNPQAVCDAIAGIAADLNARKAVGWHSSWLRQLGIPNHLNEAGVEFIADAECPDKADFIREAAAAAIGITAVDYALADSGTLCLLAGKNQSRTSSLLPTVHVAVLQPQQVIRGLDDLFALLPVEQGAMSSAITFITGPSRTADIELTLVVGVHGPQQLHVILANW
jgi:L-lactate dehydrogenase complex protein LldG